MTAPHFVPYVKESKKLINDKFTDVEYWEGIRDACEYFKELGVEDAMDTSIATQAVKELALIGA